MKISSPSKHPCFDHKHPKKVVSSENGIRSILKKTILKEKITPLSKQGKKLEVEFSSKVKSLRIPNTAWIQREDLVEVLWWSKEDDAFSMKESAKEINSYMKENPCATGEEIMKELYQPKSSDLLP